MNKRKKKKLFKSQIDGIKKQGTTDSNRWFRTMPVLGGLPSNHGSVNEENGVLKEVAVVTLGEARGHGVQLDRAFLGRVVELGNAAKSGLKCRFGHPNASGTALGTFLGRAVNFCIREDSPDVVRCDIHLDQTVSENTPNGNLYDYVIRMATKNPDMFGTSIVFKPGDDRDPAEVSPEDIAFADMPIATIREFLAVDIVDDPAANDAGLFSRFSAAQIAGRFTSFLDDNPQIWAVVDDHPEIIAPFIERYRAYKETHNQKEVNKMPKESNTPAATPEVDTPESGTPAAPEETTAATPEVDTPESVTPVATEETPAATPEETPAAAETIAASKGDTPETTEGNRIAELGRIGETYGAGVLAAAVKDKLSFEQAGALAFTEAKKENEALRKQIAETPGDDGADPVTGGDDATPVARSKYAGKLPDGVAARAEYFEKKMQAGKQ
jgi:hypothetical protein